MADAFDGESGPGPTKIASTTGRVYHSFAAPKQELAALEAAKRHVDKTRKPISVQHRLGLIHFQRLKDRDYYEEVIHPEAVHYPAIHFSKKPVEEVLASLKVNPDTGLDSETAAEVLREDIEMDKGDILAGLVTVGDSADMAGLELTLERDVDRVKRDGREQTLHALDLVQGDILRLQTGDVVPTDMVIISVISRPCIINRRNVPDYGDFISPSGLPDAQELEKAKKEKGELFRANTLGRVSSMGGKKTPEQLGLTKSSKSLTVPTGGESPLTGGSGRNLPGLQRQASSGRGLGNPEDAHQRSLSRAPSELRDHHSSLHQKLNRAGSSRFYAGSKKDIGGIHPDGSFRPPKKKVDVPFKFSTKKGLKRKEEPQPRDRWSTEGWDSGVRACMPVSDVGSIAHHGDVVEWGECIAVCTQPPKQSSWSAMWRRVLRVRGIRAQELSDEADQANSQKDQNQEFKTMKRLKTLAKMGLNITHAATAKVLGDVTCVVLEDDFRFRPSFRSSSTDSGIGIGVAADEEEFRYRYKDLLGLATRTGIAVCVMLRRNTVTEVDVARLSRWLRLPVVSVTPDHCSRPLSDMFAAGGGICLVGSELGAASGLVDAIQRCDAQSALATYKKHTVDAIRNPHGVLSHMLKTGVAEIDTNLVSMEGPSNDSKEKEKAHAEKAKTLMNSIIQDDEDNPRYQLVAFVGEDWAALSTADVGVTWNSSLSPGAYEAQKLAAVTLAENSPSRMLQAMSEYEMKVHSGSSSSGCAIA